jgi:hypothetical protein
MEIYNMDRLMPNESELERLDLLYSNLVLQYTPRRLTYSLDIGDAFTGIISILEIKLNTSFICCLPEKIIDIALCWTPAEAITVREPLSDSVTGSSFPSWSWTHWEGPIDYGFIHQTSWGVCVKMNSCIDHMWIKDTGRIREVERRNYDSAQQHGATDSPLSHMHNPEELPNNTLLFFAEPHR